MGDMETEELESIPVTAEQARISEVRARLPEVDSADDYEETTTQIVAMLACEAEGASHSLVLMSGNDIGRRYQLKDGTSSVGRAATCDIHFQEASLSRKHAGLIVDGEHVTVFDEGSKNGTYVGETPIDRIELQDGDFVRFGRLQFKYLSCTNVESAYHEELRRLTISDPMTQTFNRRHFTELLKREFSRARRHSRSLALLMLDLDRFKSINDVFGHLAGDHALRVSADIFRDSLREEDSLARFGGEEFAVILPDTGVDGATLLAQRICRKVEEYELSFRGADIPLTVSIGVSVLTDDDGVDGRSFIARADQALYAAKNSGRNRVCADSEATFSE